jgi:hypothetical protein
MTYRKTLTDWLGPGAGDVFRATAWAIPVSLLMGAVVGSHFGRLGAVCYAIAILAAAGSFGFIVGGAMLVAHGAGSAAQGITLPSGKSTPTVADYSYEKSLEIRGQLREALVSYQRHIAEQPALVAPRLLAADLHLRLGEHAAACDLLHAARACPAATAGEQLHLANRLIDLYLGPLARPDEARRELLALIRAFPGSQAAAHARAALRQLSAEAG